MKIIDLFKPVQTTCVYWILFGILVVPQVFAGEKEDALKIAYAECDKLLKISEDKGPLLNSDGNHKEYFRSADQVSKCKDQKYKKIYVPLEIKEQ